MSLTKASYSMIQGATLNVLDFGADNTGVADSTAAIQAAVIAMQDEGAALYFPSGSYLVSDSITIGEYSEGYQYASCTMFGEGINATEIVCNTANKSVFVFGDGNLSDQSQIYAGRARISNMTFTGPGGPSSIGTGSALEFIGCQGIQITNCQIWGWDKGVISESTDILSIEGSRLQYCNYGLYTYTQSGSFDYPQGSCNDYVIRHNTIAHCDTVGVYYWGGTVLNVSENDFVENATDVAVASTGGTNSVAIQANIFNNYFENNTSTSIVLGSGGVVRGGSIMNNNWLAGPSQIVIHCINVQIGLGRFPIKGNSMSVSGGVGTFTEIDYTPTTERPDYVLQTGIPYAPGSQVNFSKNMPVGSSVDILTVAGYGLVVSGLLTITQNGTGNGTSKVYAISVMGSATGGTITPTSTTTYSGGACDFDLVMTQDSPVGGTNKLTINNTSGGDATAFCEFSLNYVSGTMDLL
jgi:hypothetical protein